MGKLHPVVKPGLFENKALREERKPNLRSLVIHYPHRLGDILHHHNLRAAFHQRTRDVTAQCATTGAYYQNARLARRGASAVLPFILIHHCPLALVTPRYSRASHYQAVLHPCTKNLTLPKLGCSKNRSYMISYYYTTRSRHVDAR